MDHHPLGVERLIGWLSFAIGISALQPNDSVFYRIVYLTGVPLLWVAMFCVSGGLLVASTYLHNPRCRIILMLTLLMLWLFGLYLVATSGPIGAFGSCAIVIIVYLLRILYIKVKDGQRSAETCGDDV